MSCLNGKHVVFGEVIAGKSVVRDMVNQKMEREETTIKIYNCGELDSTETSESDEQETGALMIKVQNLYQQVELIRALILQLVEDCHCLQVELKKNKAS